MLFNLQLDALARQIQQYESTRVEITRLQDELTLLVQQGCCDMADSMQVLAVEFDEELAALEEEQARGPVVGNASPGTSAPAQALHQDGLLPIPHSHFASPTEKQLTDYPLVCNFSAEDLFTCNSTTCSGDVDSRRLCMEGCPGHQGAVSCCTYPRGVWTLVRERHVARGRGGSGDIVQQGQAISKQAPE
jgi:hypothetical protein